MEIIKIKKVLCGLFVLSVFSSCFDADIPGTELSAGSIAGDNKNYQGEPDSIRYYKVITEPELDAAIEKTNKVILQLPVAQYALRGGKEGKAPGSHQYQFQYSLTTDNYAGYFCAPHNFDGRLRSTYFYNASFNSGPNGSLIGVKNAVVPILNYPSIDSIPEMKATALLLYDYSTIDVVDIYGPFPYREYKINQQSSPYIYNNVESIYKAVAKNLDDIIACYKHFDTRPEWYKKKVLNLLKKCDKLSKDRQFESWIRLANSLKLRMAIHIAKVDDGLAKQWAEEAIAGGVIETVTQQMALHPDEIGVEPPLLTISGVWHDTRLNASYESIMKSYQHPYLDRTFGKNTIDIAEKIFKDREGNVIPSTAEPLRANTRIVGLRSGIKMLAGQGSSVNFRAGYSALDIETNIDLYSMPLYVMKLSEVLFLRAEGALRGWNMGGTAQSFYEAGVRNAFPDGEFANEYKTFVNGYLQMENPYDYTYKDPFNPRYNIGSVTKVGVKWNEGDNNETKLEKIITQKYIAGFPDSHEAWTDIRRTGYPKIFPVLGADGDGSIPIGQIIRRMIFPGKDDYSTVLDIQATGISALGGADEQNTRLWWDIAGPNF